MSWDFDSVGIFPSDLNVSTSWISADLSLMMYLPETGFTDSLNSALSTRGLSQDMFTAAFGQETERPSTTGVSYG